MRSRTGSAARLGVRLLITFAIMQKKGALLAVDGRLQTRSYDNASGQKVHVTEVVCERVEIQRQASTQTGKQQTRLNQGFQYADGGFANSYTSSGYQDPFADDYGSGPTLDISSDDLPFN